MQGIPSFNEPMAELGKRFLRAFERATPDFQAKLGYEVDAPGQADMTIASNAVRRGAAGRWLSWSLQGCCNPLLALKAGCAVYAMLKGHTAWAKICHEITSCICTSYIHLHKLHTYESTAVTCLHNLRKASLSAFVQVHWCQLREKVLWGTATQCFMWALRARSLAGALHAKSSSSSLCGDVEGYVTVYVLGAV